MRRVCVPEDLSALVLSGSQLHTIMEKPMCRKSLIILTMHPFNWRF
uniref:Uncharacterized protein n=1 Tax=Setaria italica TaxID=4555 RepID=K3XTR3_SETIT